MRMFIEQPEGMGKNQDAAKEFLKFLQGPEKKNIKAQRSCIAAAPKSRQWFWLTAVHKLRLSETATNYTEYEFSNKKFNSLKDETKFTIR